MEDMALRDLARQLRDTSKEATAQQLDTLHKELAEPVRQACDADDYITRQRLVGKAFAGLLDANLECFRQASASIEQVHSSAQAALGDAAGTVVTEPVPIRPIEPSFQYAPPATVPAAAAPQVAMFDDLLGGVDNAPQMVPPCKTTTAATSPPADLLDFGFEAPSVVPNAQSGNDNVVPPARPEQPKNDLFGFDFNASSTPPKPTSPPHTSNNNDTNSIGGGLGGMVWPSKEDEDETCIRARVEAWQEGKKLRAMLVTLHEVAPKSSGWTPVQLSAVMQPADVKSAYRKAVLAVHPDKLPPKERKLGHCVFEVLCEQWKEFRMSG